MWPLLRQSADNSRRTYVTRLLGEAGISPAVVIKRLQSEPDLSVRRALILSLGSFTGHQISEVQRRHLVPTLLRWYRDEAGAGIHGAIDWLLRYGRRGQVARPLDWQQHEALASIDRMQVDRPIEGRHWYVTREGETMVVIRSPVEFRMGAPAYERPRKPASDSADEPLHQVRIPRSFAIASKEVTIGEFRRFLDVNPEAKRRHVYPEGPARMAQVLARLSPDDDGPQISVTWYEAAMYCNWLSKQEGLPPSEWAYPEDITSFQNGMELPKDYLRRRGYRLPTEAEWEYATRAGSVTSRFYGSSEDLLDAYAWYSKHPPQTKDGPVDPSDPQRTWPVGQLKPNDFGLFDVYGNVWEWTQDRLRDFEPGSVRTDVEDDVLRVEDTVSRVRRGGAFSYEAAMERSAHRGTVNAYPTTRRDTVGFRVARTYP